MKKILALACIVFFVANSMADIVYTTANTAGTASNTNVPANPNSQEQGFAIGRFDSNENFNMSNQKAVVRFNTGSSTNLNFSGIRWNSFLDNRTNTPGLGGVISGSFLWTLYNN